MICELQDKCFWNEGCAGLLFKEVNKMRTHDHDTRLQAGVWDVDGTGMQNIDDPEVDLGIRKVMYQLVLLHAECLEALFCYSVSSSSCSALWRVC